MPRAAQKLAPALRPEVWVDMEVLEEAGTVAAHGFPNFPRYVTAQLDDPDLDYRVALHMVTSSKGSQITGFQLAPKPYQPLQLSDMPSVEKVLAQMDLKPFMREMITTLKIACSGLSGSDLVDVASPRHAEAKALAQRLFAEERSIQPRRYRPRHGATLEHVANVYEAAFLAGQNPTRAVQAACGPMGYSTASALVREARAEGLLPPATKGRPGWVREGEQ